MICTIIFITIGIYFNFDHKNSISANILGDKILLGGGQACAFC